MKKIKNRQDFLVLLTIVAAGLFVGVNFVLTPLQHWWSDRQAQVRQLREQVANGRGLIRREAAIRSHWGDMLTNALPANSSQAEQQFLKALDGWARDSGVAVTEIAPQWKNEGTNYMTLQCRVETGGDLAALSKFIYDIERGPLMTRLDSLELSSSSHEDNGQTLTLGLQINALALLQNNRK